MWVGSVSPRVTAMGPVAGAPEAGVVDGDEPGSAADVENPPLFPTVFPELHPAASMATVTSSPTYIFVRIAPPLSWGYVRARILLPVPSNGSRRG